MPEIFEAATGLVSARFVGLMLLPPAVDDPEQARPFFRAARELRDELVARGVDKSMLAELSMGMSQDFEIAIEEGATLVRVGSAIFGRRGPGRLPGPTDPGRLRSGASRPDKPESPGGQSTMNVSPLDLRQQRFRSAFRGFDKIEVASFLAAVADDYEQALRETDRLRRMPPGWRRHSTSTASRKRT